jgi:hypothetical protein
MTHSELVYLSAKWLQENQKCPVVLLEPKVTIGENPDVIGFFDGGDCLVIECKISRGDFAIDQEKHYRHCEENGMGDYRYYSASDKSIIRDLEEIPESWGVISWNGKSFDILRESKEFKKSREDSEISLLVAAIRTSKIMQNSCNKLSFYQGNRKYPRYRDPKLEEFYEDLFRKEKEREDSEKERGKEEKLEFVRDYNKNFPSPDGKFHEVVVL